MNTKRKLSPRQKRAAEAFVGKAKGSKKKALLLAGYPKSVATKCQAREFTTDMQAYVRELLDREGISDSYLVKQHKALFHAKTAHYFDGVKIDETPNSEARYNAVKLGYSIKGLLKPEVDAQQIIQIVVQSVTAVITEFVPKPKQDAAFAAIQRTIIAPATGQSV